MNFLGTTGRASASNEELLPRTEIVRRSLPKFCPSAEGTELLPPQLTGGRLSAAETRKSLFSMRQASLEEAVPRKATAWV